MAVIFINPCIVFVIHAHHLLTEKGFIRALHLCINMYFANFYKPQNGVSLRFNTKGAGARALRTGG